MEENIKILGVRIDNFSVGKIKEKISNIFDSIPEQKFITTLNPEILLKAHRDEKYREVLNSADLNICDGFGIRVAGFLKGKKIKARFAGTDLVDFLLKIASRRNLPVLAIVAKNSLSAPAEIERAIRGKYPNLSVKSEYFSPGQSNAPDAIIKEAEIIFVNFGAPEQEKFIFENRQEFPKAKILVGVGGTFDFLAGRIRRAPLFMRAIGLEWLWRLFQEPKRFRRIWNAVVIFPIVVIMEKNKNY